MAALVLKNRQLSWSNETIHRPIVIKASPLIFFDALAIGISEGALRQFGGRKRGRINVVGASMTAGTRITFGKPNTLHEKTIP